MEGTSLCLPKTWWDDPIEDGSPLRMGGGMVPIEDHGSFCMKTGPPPPGTREFK